MCGHDDGQAHGHRADVSAGMPRPVEGDAVDPIVLEPVDEVVVTTLVNNSYDGLMVDMGPAERMAMGRTPPVPCALFEEGNTVERLGLYVTAIEAVVLSHGHFEHAGGFEGFARLRRRDGLPLVLHRHVWSRRRIGMPGVWEKRGPRELRGGIPCAFICRTSTHSRSHPTASSGLSCCPPAPNQDEPARLPWCAHEERSGGRHRADRCTVQGRLPDRMLRLAAHRLDNASKLVEAVAARDAHESGWRPR